MGNPSFGKIVIGWMLSTVFSPFDTLTKVGCERARPDNLSDQHNNSLMVCCESRIPLDGLYLDHGAGHGAGPLWRTKTHSGCRNRMNGPGVSNTRTTGKQNSYPVVSCP